MILSFNKWTKLKRIKLLTLSPKFGPWCVYADHLSPRHPHCGVWRPPRWRALSAQLTSLPDSVGQMESLRVLVLDHNKLTTLPQFDRSSKLESLSVAWNLLVELPETLDGERHAPPLRATVTSGAPPPLHPASGGRNNLKNRVASELTPLNAACLQRARS